MAMTRPASWLPMIVVAMAQILVVWNVATLKISIDGIVSSFDTAATAVKTAIVTHTLVVAGFILLGAKIGQLFGSRRVFRATLAMFAASMLIMTLSATPAAMMIAQITAGVAAAALIPTLVVLIAENYREPQYTKALSWLGGVQSMGIVPAVLIAAAAATWIGWRFTYALLAVLAAAIFKLSEKLDGANKPAPFRIDRVGALLAGVAILLIGLGCDNLSHWGVLWASSRAPFSLLNFSPAPLVILSGVILFKAFLMWSRRCHITGLTPLIATEMIDTAPKRAVLFAMFIVGALGAAISFLIPLYVEIVQGRSSLHTAMAIIPFALGSFVAAFLVVRLRGGLRAGYIARYAFLAMAFGAALLGLTIRNDWGSAMTVLGLSLAGIGEGALATLLFDVLVTAAPKNLAVEAGPLCGTTNYLAAGVGIAVSGALVTITLALSLHRELADNPRIPEGLKAEVNLDQPSFVSNDRLREVLARAAATPEQLTEAVRINTQARLLALKISLLTLAGVALFAALRCASLPD